MPEQPGAGQGRDVVRRHLGRRLARGQGLPVAGKIGYVPAPVVKTKNSGWLYAWSWAIEHASKKRDEAWKFISWASSKDYEKLVGSKLGWTNVPAGKRLSTYDNPQYVQASKAFAAPTEEAIQAADPRTRASSPVRSAASSSWTSRSSAPWPPPSRSTSAPPSPARLSVQKALQRGRRWRPGRERPTEQEMTVTTHRPVPSARRAHPGRTTCAAARTGLGGRRCCRH